MNIFWKAKEQSKVAFDKKWLERIQISLLFFYNFFSVTPNHLLLSGHVGSVTCLLYPHDENPRYDKSYLISGGVDFTVRAWDLSSKTLLHTFNCHGGEVSRLFVTPPQCNVRVLYLLRVSKHVITVKKKVLCIFIYLQQWNKILYAKLLLVPSKNWLLKRILV